MHERLGTGAHRIAILMTHPGENFEEVKAQLENAALRLAEMLELGTTVGSQYSFDGETLFEFRNTLNYEKKLQPLCPVAVKLNQTEIHAPNHDTWGVVSCDSCGDQFYVGPNRIYGSRKTGEAISKQLEIILAEDHRLGRPHLNGYELPD